MTPGPRASTHTTSSFRQRAAGIAGSLAVLCVFLAAVFVLHRELREYRLRDIEQHLSQLGWGQLCKGLLLMMTSYTLLTGYDWLALKYIDRSLPYTRIALASFVSYVCSYNFGAILGGSTMRYRLYSSFGLSAVEVVKIIAITTLTFVLGFCTLAGLVFVFDPLPLPVSLKAPLTTVFPIGVGLLAFVAVYLAASALWHRPISLRGWDLALPGPRFTFMQMGIATADLMAAAGVLYVLLPREIEVSYPQFLGIFLSAQFVGIISHVPGGLGVVEAVLLVTLAPQDKAALMGSIVVYRLTYYLLPLGVATALLAAHEGLGRRESLARFAYLFGRWAPAIIPRLLACTTFAAGAALLACNALPRTIGRWHSLSDNVPLPIIELSHFLGSVAGVGLLIIARGLLERLARAYHLAVALLSIGIVVSLVRGFNIEEALILTLSLAALIPCKPYFRRQASLVGEMFSPGSITAIILVLLGTLWLGIFSHKHIEYSHSLWWRFALQEDAPRALRTAIGALLTLFGAGVLWLLRPAEPAPHTPDEAELAAAARIVETSTRTSAALALLGDKTLLFNASRTAFLMYGIEGGSRVSLGDPVGYQSEAAELAWQFHELCDHHAQNAVFYQVTDEQLPLYLDLGLSSFKLGEEARVSLPTFGIKDAAQRWQRDALDGFARAGHRLEVIPPPDVQALLPQLREISDQWLAARRAHEKGFSLAFFQPSYLGRFPVAVVRDKRDIVAFAQVLTGAEREELSVDLIRYRPDCAPGIMDGLLVELMQWSKSEGYSWFNLGTAPLSGADAGPLAPLWNRLGTLAFRHGEHFDSIAALREYKARFAPQWEPRYLASPGGLRLPRILADVAALISADPNRR